MDINILRQDDTEERVFSIPFLDGKIGVLFVPADEINKLVKAATMKGWNDKHQATEEFDIIKYRKLLGRKAVRTIEGFTDKGQPLTYTPENIDFLMMKWADFARCVDRACGDIQVLMEAEKADAEKNNSSPAGEIGLPAGELRKL